jgi:hypothetical protein
MEQNYSSTGTTSSFPLQNKVLASTKIETLICPSAPSDRADADGDAYPTSDTKAIVNPTQSGFSTEGLYCAITDYSATTFVDSRLGKGANPINDIYADVTGTNAPTAYLPSLGDGMLPKDYSENGKSRPKLSDVTDGLSNTIAVAECAGRPYVYIGGKRGDSLGSTQVSFPTRRVNGGGWCRPASDFSIDGASADGQTFGSPGTLTKVINATNGQSDESASYYGVEGTGEAYGFHPGGSQVVFGDGAVRLISKDVTVRVFTSLVTRAGAEIMDKKSAGL